MSYPHPMDDKVGFEATDEELGYGIIMVCQACGWRGPLYLMFQPTKYPGMPRCAECKSDNTGAAS